MASGRVNAKIQRGHCFTIPLKVRRFDHDALHFQGDVPGGLFLCMGFHSGRRAFGYSMVSGVRLVPAPSIFMTTFGPSLE